jgi:hypothetical protein
MPKLRSLIGGLLVLTSAQLCAEEQPYAVPFEVGQRVEIVLAKPYRTEAGVRIAVPWTRLDGKETLTLEAGGYEKELVWPAERGRVQGLLTAVDDVWLTLDLGEKQPVLRIPRRAIVEIVHSEIDRPPAQDPTSPTSAPGVGDKVEIVLAKPYRTGEGVRVQDTSTRLANKDLFTLVAGGQEERLPQIAERGRVQGLLTAVEDTWLTLDLGEKQPLLRIPRVAVVRWETLSAPGSGPLPTGQRIRFFSKELGTLLTGRLRAIDDETLLLKVDDRAQPIRLRRSSIEQIEVSHGRRGHAGTGAVIGASVVGIPLGILVGLNGGPLLEGSRPASLRAFWDGLSGGAILGAAIGAVIGSASKTERWERVPLSVAVAPQRRGARAALTLRF